LSNIRQVFWIGAVAVGARASQNTLLRHIPVTLGLRHPWLRTVLGGRSTNAYPTAELYSALSIKRKYAHFVDKMNEITPVTAPLPPTAHVSGPRLPDCQGHPGCPLYLSH